MMLNDFTINLDETPPVIKFTVQPSDLPGLHAVLDGIISQHNLHTTFEFSDDPAHPILQIPLDDFATLESYVLATPSLGLKKDILKEEVDRLISGQKLELSAGLITNGRTNSTIANMMLSKAFDIPI